MHLIVDVRQHQLRSRQMRSWSARTSTTVLHPTALHVFYRADENSRPVRASLVVRCRNCGPSTPPRLVRAAGPRPSTPPRCCSSSARGGYPGLPASFDGDIEDIERQWLERSAGHLAVRITGTGDRVVGVLLLGERKSDEPVLRDGSAPAAGHRVAGSVSSMRISISRNVCGGTPMSAATCSLDSRTAAAAGSRNAPCAGRCYDGASERCDADGAEVALTLPIERTLDWQVTGSIARWAVAASAPCSKPLTCDCGVSRSRPRSCWGRTSAIRRRSGDSSVKRAPRREIDHRNITRVHDYGAVGSGGAYLDHGAGDRPDGGGRSCSVPGLLLPRGRSEWFRQLLEGLQFAHKLGVIHRELKR